MELKLYCWNEDEESIFIDDNIRNFDGAANLGINSFVLCRDWRAYFYNKVRYRNHSIVRNLAEVYTILKK